MCQTQSLGKTTVKEINTFAISVLIYYFGEIRLTKTDLENLQ